MVQMVTYLIGTAYFFLIIEIFIIIKSFLYAHKERKAKRPDYAPKAAIIAPHYGWDTQISENAKRLLDQDYDGDFEIFFVTNQTGTSGYDDSYQPLVEIARDQTNARVLLAPNIIDNSLPRSQKVQNLMTAIGALSDDVEVIAFVDADSTIQKDWLKLLVQPLQDKNVGAAVGARFYVPQRFNFASLVESIWINFQIAFQGDHALTMVWGGSNAIRRDLLNIGSVLERWENAPIEDHNLTHTVKDLKLKVHFVPDCIAVTQTDNRTWSQILEFTNRQMVMTFRMGLKAQWILTLLIFLPKALIVFASIPLVFHYNRLILVFLVPFIEIQSYRLFSKNLPQWLKDDPQVRENIRITAFATPASMFLAGINAVYAMFKNKIVWGGVRYEILSATKCRILGTINRPNNNQPSG